MKLQTVIPARRDGTVNVLGADGQSYTFTADEAGVLTADVGHDATAAQLLASGNFWPANPEDMDAALRLTGGDADDLDGDEGNEPGEDDGDETDEGDEQEHAQDGMPVEANTPLKPAPSVKAGGKPRKAR